MCYGICHEIVTDIDDHNAFKSMLHHSIERRGGVSQEFLVLLRMISFQKNKYRFTHAEIDIERPQQYPRSDLHLVRTAIAEGLSVITNDEKLHESINKSSECKEKRIRAYTDEEALDYILTQKKSK